MFLEEEEVDFEDKAGEDVCLVKGPWAAGDTVVSGCAWFIV
jgi:hypothetical protein